MERSPVYVAPHRTPRGVGQKPGIAWVNNPGIGWVRLLGNGGVKNSGSGHFAPGAIFLKEIGMPEDFSYLTLFYTYFVSDLETWKARFDLAFQYTLDEVERVLSEIEISPTYQGTETPTQPYAPSEPLAVLSKNEYRNSQICPTVMSMLINVSRAHWELIYRALTQGLTSQLSDKAEKKLERIVLFFSWSILTRKSESTPQLLRSQEEQRELLSDIITYCRQIVWGETESEKADIEQVFNDLSNKVGHTNQVDTATVIRVTAELLQQQSGLSSNNLLLAVIQRELHRIASAVESNLPLAILQNLQHDRKLVLPKIALHQIPQPFSRFFAKGTDLIIFGVLSGVVIRLFVQSDFWEDYGKLAN